MRDVKYRMETLCLYDYRGVEEHLRAMAARGWWLERAGNRLWKYRRAEPEEVRYAVTYSVEASQFNPEPTEGQRSLEELCAAAGWRKVDDWFQMQIFCTRDPHAVSLETDEGLRLEGIHRAMRKNFLPGNAVALLLSLLMGGAFVGTLFVKPFRVFERNSSLFSGVLFVLAAALMVYTLWHYYHWRRRSLRSVAEGGGCVPLGRGYRLVSRVGMAALLALCAIYLALELMTSGRGYALLFLVYMALLFVMVFLVRGTTVLLKRRGVSKWRNIAGTLAVDVLLAFAMVGVLSWGIIRFGWFLGGSGERYTYDHTEWDLYPREDVPLTLSELTGELYEHVSREWRGEGSFFLPRWQYWEHVLREDGGEKERTGLSYTIWQPRMEWLSEALVRDLLEDDRPAGLPGLRRQYVAEDPVPWGAEAVYRRWLNGEPTENWLLCFPGRVASLSMDRTPTAEQMRLAGERLGAEV